MEFYINMNKKIKPINDEYNKINDQFHLFDILSNLWDIDTCAPRLRNKWNKDNKTCGQCSITAFLVQDIFGGDVYGIKIDDTNYHCFNVFDNLIFDLTSHQFSNKLNYKNMELQLRENHFKKIEKYERYLLLKSKLKEYLK